MREKPLLLFAKYLKALMELDTARSYHLQLSEFLKLFKLQTSVTFKNSEDNHHIEKNHIPNWITS